MEFREHVPVLKKDIKVPKGVAWYEGLHALPKHAFSKNVLIAAGVSDKWPHDSQKVVVDLYNKAFTACAGVMGVRPLEDGEEY
ncbi:hypothetical protein Hanom_Chr08g00745121 [Helianthus anomalus]